MSERWWRAWEDFSCDPKFFGVSARSGQTLERVVFVWVRILGSAAKLRSGGAYRLDPVETAAILRCKPINITMILAAMEKAELVADGVVVNWAKRQFEKVDSEEPEEAGISPGAHRTREWRKRKRDGGDVTDVTPVTSPSVTVTPPESESQSEPEIKTNTATPREKPIDRPSKQIPLILTIPGGGQPASPKPAIDHNALETALRQAAGPSLNAASTGLLILSDPMRWLENGCDLHADVLPTIGAVSARTKPGRVRSWHFFTAAVFEARDRRQTGPPASLSPVIDIAGNRKGGFVERRSPRTSIVDAVLRESGRDGSCRTG